MLSVTFLLNVTTTKLFFIDIIYYILVLHQHLAQHLK